MWVLYNSTRLLFSTGFRRSPIATAQVKSPSLFVSLAQRERQSRRQVKSEKKGGRIQSHYLLHRKQEEEKIPLRHPESLLYTSIYARGGGGGDGFSAWVFAV